MPIDRDGEGPPLRREEAKTSGRGTDDLRATPFTEDVFGDDDYYGRKRKGGAFGLIAGVVFGAAVAAFAGWYVLGTREASVATGAPGSGGLVRAESMPYKVKPEDPGGLQVENQDKLVYERLDKSAKPAERVENLLPAPEQPKAPPVKKAEAAPTQPVQPAQPTASKADDPLAKLVAKVEGVKAPPPAEKAAAPPPAVAADKPMTPAAPAAMSAEKPMTPAAPPPKAEQVAAATPPTPPPAPKAAPTLPPAAAAPTPTPPSAPPIVTNAPQPATTAAPTVPPKPTPTVVAEAPQAAPAAVPAARVPSATPAAVPPGAMFLQLASARSEDAAMGEWKRISAKNGDLIGTFTPSVVVADLGERGTFYRLRAGPVADKPTADGICASLASRNVGCIVVRP